MTDKTWVRHPRRTGAENLRIWHKYFDGPGYRVYALVLVNDDRRAQNADLPASVRPQDTFWDVTLDTGRGHYTCSGRGHNEVALKASLTRAILQLIRAGEVPKYGPAGHLLATGTAWR
jgi:hypothetical protein